MTEPDPLSSLLLLRAVRDSAFTYRSREHFYDNAPQVVRLALNTVVLKGSDGLVLFDPGPGDPSVWIDGLDEQTRRMSFSFSGGLFSFLSSIGGPQAVAAIVLTHHHPDHIGALFTRDGRREKVFANATVYSPCSRQLERYSKAYLGDAMAYKHQETADCCPEIESFTCEEHCDSHTCYRVPLSDGRCLVVWGDLLPTAMHLRPKFRGLLFARPPDFYFPLMQSAADNSCLNLLSHDPRRALVTLEGGGEQFTVGRVL